MARVKLSTGEEYDRAEALKEAGGDDLLMGAVADGEFLKRDGDEIVGATGAVAPAEQLDANGTILDVNVIADGEYLKRVGTTVVGDAGSGGPATQLDSDGTTLDVNAIADGEYLKRVGTTVVGAAATGAPTDAEYWVEALHAGLSGEVAVGATGIHTAAYASRNAAAKAGRLFLPDNGFVIERDTGSAWAPWGPIYPLTRPVDADFAWINQGGASVVDGGGGICLIAPGGTINVRLRKKAAPATPYVITACILPMLPAATTDSAGFGLAFREAGTGELQVFGWGNQAGGGAKMISWKFTSPTAFSASYNTFAIVPSTPVWLRIADNGTNRICSWSPDGQNWFVFHTVGRTDFLTADEVGFFIYTQFSITPETAITLLSWKEG